MHDRVQGRGASAEAKAAVASAARSSSPASGEDPVSELPREREESGFSGLLDLAGDRVGIHHRRTAGPEEGGHR